jgi:Na+-driven multidrug efflux pump
MGFAQALQPVAGFNYGAKRYAKAKLALRISTIRSTAFGFGAFLFLILLADPLMRIFSDDPELIRIAVPALRVIVAAFPLIAFQLMGASLLQAHGRALSAFILSLSRQILILIPLILVLGRLFGLDGVFVAFPISDLASAAVAALLIYAEVRYLNRMQAEENVRTAVD